MGNLGTRNSMYKDTEAWNNTVSLGNYKPFDIAGALNARGGMQRYFIGEATDTNTCNWKCVFLFADDYVCLLSFQNTSISL